VVDLVRPIFDPGEVTLINSEPLTQPAIDFNFFSNDLDIITMREGMRFAYDLLTKADGLRELVILEYPWEMPLDSDAKMKPQCWTGAKRCSTLLGPPDSQRTSNRALVILS
jgi:choline dehydrogenase